MSKPKDECITPRCDGKRYCRGVCLACYCQCRRSIEAGETTDAELVRKRLWLAPNRTGRPSKNKIAKLIRAKVAGK